MKDQNIYTSMRSAASNEGIEYKILKAAKDAGCPGFTSSGRVIMELVRPWLDANLEELQQKDNEEEYWSLERLKYQALREKYAYETERTLYFKKEEAQAQLQALSDITETVLNNVLLKDLPPKLAGLGEIEMRARMRKVTDEICTTFQSV